MVAGCTPITAATLAMEYFGSVAFEGIFVTRFLQISQGTSCAEMRVICMADFDWEFARYESISGERVSGNLTRFPKSTPRQDKRKLIFALALINPLRCRICLRIGFSSQSVKPLFDFTVLKSTFFQICLHECPSG